MEQLKAEMRRLTVDIERALHLLEDTQHVLAVERWWRRVLVGFVVVTLLAAGAWMSWDRQEACDRANASREAIREGAVGDWSTAWDTLVTAEDPEAKAALLAAIDQNRRESLPPRDCSWPV